MLLWGAWELELFLEALLVQLALVTPSEREMVRSWHLGDTHTAGLGCSTPKPCAVPLRQRDWPEADRKSLFPQPQVS